MLVSTRACPFVKRAFSKDSPQYCRKVCLNMVQNGHFDHFGQNDLIPNWILAHFGLKRSILVHLWVRNRPGEHRPGDIRPNHFVYTCAGTRVSTHVSTRVGAFPVLPFLAFWKKARKTTKKTRIFYPYQTPRNPGKEGKKRSKKQGIPRKGKKQGIPKKAKEWQGLYGIITQRKPAFVDTLVYTSSLAWALAWALAGALFVGALVGHISLSLALCFTEFRSAHFTLATPHFRPSRILKGMVTWGIHKKAYDPRWRAIFGFNMSRNKGKYEESGKKKTKKRKKTEPCKNWGNSLRFFYPSVPTRRG